MKELELFVQENPLARSGAIYGVKHPDGHEELFSDKERCEARGAQLTYKYWAGAYADSVREELAEGKAAEWARKDAARYPDIAKLQ